LIFFVVTATFLSEFGVGVAGDSSSQDSQPDQENMLFEIRPNNEIFFNRQPRPVLASQVRANIIQFRSENPDASVIIQPENDSHVSTLVMIIDAARQAGMNNISVVPPA
jgi:biopolymer transport protein ExbD